MNLIPKTRSRTGNVPHAGEASSLRVLHLGKFYPPYRGGMETYSEALCKSLARKVQVKVIVAGGGGQCELIDGVQVVRLKTAVNIAGGPLCMGMVEAIRKSPCDVIHMQWPNPMAVIAYLLSRHPARLVITYQSDVVRQKFLGAAFDPILRMAMRRSAAVIVTSPNYIDSSPVLQQFRDRCHMIPLGIDVFPFERYDPLRVGELRTRFGPRIVLAAGRLVYYKGFQYLVSAMRSVDGHLLIVGQGPLRNELLRQIQAEGVGDRVTLLGGVENMVPYYHAADIFVLPSVARSEAFGLVQLEAMACGKPVVNTDLKSGVPFVSLHGVTGLTIQPSDAAELAAALRVLLGNDRFRLRLGEAAFRRVRGEFCVEKMAERTLSLFYDAVAGKTPVPTA